MSPTLGPSSHFRELPPVHRPGRKRGRDRPNRNDIDPVEHSHLIRRRPCALTTFTFTALPRHATYAPPILPIINMSLNIPSTSRKYGPSTCSVYFCSRSGRLGCGPRPRPAYMRGGMGSTGGLTPAARLSVGTWCSSGANRVRAVDSFGGLSREHLARFGPPDGVRSAAVPLPADGTAHER